MKDASIQGAKDRYFYRTIACLESKEEKKVVLL